MFPFDRDPLPPSRRTLGAALADAADLLVAFVTLESYGLADLRPARAAVVPEAVEVASRRSPAGGNGVVSGDRGSDRGHRHTIPGTPRARRPGSVPTRPQPCRTPVADGPAATSADAPPSRTA